MFADVDLILTSINWRVIQRPALYPGLVELLTTSELPPLIPSHPLYTVLLEKGKNSLGETTEK